MISCTACRGPLGGVELTAQHRDRRLPVHEGDLPGRELPVGLVDLVTQRIEHVVAGLDRLDGMNRTPVDESNSLSVTWRSSSAASIDSPEQASGYVSLLTQR